MAAPIKKCHKYFLPLYRYWRRVGVYGLPAFSTSISLFDKKSDDDTDDINLKLATPPAYKPPRRSRKSNRHQAEDVESSGKRLFSAVESVANHLGGTPDSVSSTTSDLLQQLKSIKDTVVEQKKGKLPPSKTTQSSRTGLPSVFSQLRVNVEEKKSSSRKDKSGRNDLELEPLGIFQKQESTSVARQQSSLFNMLQEAESKQRMTLPPDNAFEDQVRMTQDGKLWHYPVNNEQGWDTENAVGFHEHVFLEDQLDDGFPAVGPVRHFMELVCVGLSKNPYLTVQQKHEHIAWFRQYFAEKKDILDATIVDKRDSVTL